MVLIFQTMPLVKGKAQMQCEYRCVAGGQWSYDKKNGKLEGYTHYYSAFFVEVYHSDSQ